MKKIILTAFLLLFFCFPVNSEAKDSDPPPFYQNIIVQLLTLLGVGGVGYFGGSKAASSSGDDVQKEVSETGQKVQLLKHETDLQIKQLGMQIETMQRTLENNVTIIMAKLDKQDVQLKALETNIGIVNKKVNDVQAYTKMKDPQFAVTFSGLNEIF